MRYRSKTEATQHRLQTLDYVDAATFYDFRLKAVNEGGESDWVSLAVATQAKPLPIANIYSDRMTIQDGCSTMLSGIQSQSIQVTNMTYLWDLDGDGVYETTGGEVWFSTNNIIGKPGTKHTVYHKVKNESGVESEPVSMDIAIDAAAPTYTVSAPEDLIAKRGASWEISAVTSSYRPIMSWDIDWGDGSEPTQILGGPRSRVSLHHLGIILCSDKDDTVVHYSVMKGSQQLFASKYRLVLPSEEELRLELERRHVLRIGGKEEQLNEHHSR